MAYIRADRVMETSSTTGTGAFTLAGAVAGFRTFASVLSVGDTVHYYIELVGATGIPTGEWETGLGTYSGANTLTRTTVIASSNGGAAVNFSAGTKRVAISHITASVLATQNNLSDLASASTARTNLGLVAGGAGDIWVEKAGDTMTGNLRTTGVGVGADADSTKVFNAYVASAGGAYLDSDAQALFELKTAVASSTCGQMRSRKARGTVASPAVVIQNDLLWAIQAYGYGGTDWRRGAELNFRAIAATPSDTDMETKFTIELTPSASVTTSEIFRLEHATGLSLFGANPVIDANRLFRLRSYTVATLPTVGTAGRLAKVTDATAPTYNATVTGGGAVDVPVYDNGTNWTCH